MSSRKNPVIISLEGNIGSGKSTLLQSLKMDYLEKVENQLIGYKVEFIEEPVDVWNTFIDNGDNETVLQKYYKNPVKYGFPFQMITIMTRIKAINETMKKNPDIIITERSPYSDKEIFVRSARQYGYMNDIEFQTYEYYYNQYNKQCKLDGIVYLKIDPFTCCNNIKKRNREGEDDISNEYMNSLDELDCKLYEGFTKRKMSVNKNELYDDNDYLLYTIYEFIKTIIADLPYTSRT